MGKLFLKFMKMRGSSDYFKSPYLTK